MKLRYSKCIKILLKDRRQFKYYKILAIINENFLLHITSPKNMIELIAHIFIANIFIEGKYYSDLDYHFLT